MPDLNQKLEWTDEDRKAVDTARVLAADAVEKVGNGHPGTAMSLAPVAHLLFQKVMRHDPSDDRWTGRDRFILSPGHTSLTLYTQLFLNGYGLELKDLESLRTWGSLTPGHPEYKHTPGVEITTGPLGQGLASAVGFAYAQRYVRGLLDPEAGEGQSPFDHMIYTIASDGDLQVGVLLLDGSQQAEVAVELVVRVLAHRAGVEDDDVRLALGDGHKTRLFEESGHPLGVVDVHLAAESAHLIGAGTSGRCHRGIHLPILGCLCVGLRAARSQSPRRHSGATTGRPPPDHTPCEPQRRPLSG